MNVNFTLLDIFSNKIFSINRDGLKEVLNIQNGIEIPMLQRDYAQGRTDEKTEYIRNKFLEDIREVLENNEIHKKQEKINLDFIYGYVENSTFVPLDGQQRLTTLYIIHWFIAFKDQVNFEEKGLQLFTYKTRQSAKEFLKSINTKQNQEKLRRECNSDYSRLVCIIRNQPWYNLRWENDPTVKGFLTTLETVQTKFININFSTIEKEKPITYHFLKIDEWGMGDNLYIKMNSRGKPLSDFENFKASFENIIDGHPSSKVFVNKIDRDWLDAFWKYSLQHNPNIIVEENVEILTKKCDYLLLEFIKKVIEYIYYNKGYEGVFEFNDSTLEKLFDKWDGENEEGREKEKNEDNLILLIQVLDKISESDYPCWSNYFNHLFSENWEVDKIAVHQSDWSFIIRLFDGESFSHFENLLFFAWLNYITRSNSTAIKEDMKDFLRIVRNFINNINQKNKTSLDTELRPDYYLYILQNINKIALINPFESLNTNEILFRKEYIQYEVNKYSLFGKDKELKQLIFKFEDYPELKGLIFNFDFNDFNNLEIRNIVENFYSMFKCLDYKDIIRLLLCFGDYSTKVGNSNLGDFKFLGKNEKGNERWHRILASPEGEIKGNFVALFKIFSPEIISDWSLVVENVVKKNIDKYKNSWLFYCLQSSYKHILDHALYTQSANNRIEIFYNQSLNSFHYNPFVYWFRFHSSAEVKENINELESCAQYSNYSRLHLKNGVELEQIGNEWRIYNLLTREDCIYLYDEEEKCHILKCNHLIEDLIPYIKQLNHSITILTHD